MITMIVILNDQEIDFEDSFLSFFCVINPKDFRRSGRATALVLFKLR